MREHIEHQQRSLLSGPQLQDMQGTPLSNREHDRRPPSHPAEATDRICIRAFGTAACRTHRSRDGRHMDPEERVREVEA